MRGIGTGTFGSIILYHVLGRKEQLGDINGMKAKAQSGAGDF